MVALSCICRGSVSCWGGSCFVVVLNLLLLPARQEHPFMATEVFTDCHVSCHHRVLLVNVLLGGEERLAAFVQVTHAAVVTAAVHVWSKRSESKVDFYVLSSQFVILHTSPLLS